MIKIQELLFRKSLFKKAFFSTVWQCILFGLAFAIYTQIYNISHAYTITARDAAILYVAVPVISGVVWYRLMSRSGFKVQKRNEKSKAHKNRVAGRLVAVSCFILIGYGLEKIRVENLEFVVRLFELSGMNNSFAFEFIFRFSTYILVAIFPISYAVAEYLFAPAVQEQNVN